MGIAIPEGEREDLLQEAVLGALKRGSTSGSAIYRACQDALRRWIRQRARCVPLSAAAADAIPVQDPEEEEDWGFLLELPVNLRPVAFCLAKGLTTADTASTLGMSVRWVRYRIEDLRRVLG
jgi:DNA-directed RNA polymerase specialized sigma24 family protein